MTSLQPRVAPHRALHPRAGVRLRAPPGTCDRALADAVEAAERSLAAAPGPGGDSARESSRGRRRRET